MATIGLSFLNAVWQYGRFPLAIAAITSAIAWRGTLQTWVTRRVLVECLRHVGVTGYTRVGLRTRAGRLEQQLRQEAGQLIDDPSHCAIEKDPLVLADVVGTEREQLIEALKQGWTLTDWLCSASIFGPAVRARGIRPADPARSQITAPGDCRVARSDRATVSARFHAPGNQSELDDAIQASAATSLPPKAAYLLSRSGPDAGSRRQDPAGSPRVVEFHPVHIKVMAIKPNRLCGTFGFHPILGFRRKSQARSISHGGASTLLTFARAAQDPAQSRSPAEWGIAVGAIPLVTDRAAAFTRERKPGDGLCWLSDQPCPDRNTHLRSI